MPRVVDGIVLAQDREPVRVGAPEGAVFRHIGHDDTLVLVLVSVRRVKLVVGDGRPAHPALSCPVHDASVDFAEILVDVVVEACADADAGGPALNMAHLLV